MYRMQYITSISIVLKTFARDAQINRVGAVDLQTFMRLVGTRPCSVLVGADVRLQHCVDPGLVASPLVLEPFENVRIKAQRD